MSAGMQMRTGMSRQHALRSLSSAPDLDGLGLEIPHEDYSDLRRPPPTVVEFGPGELADLQSRFDLLQGDRKGARSPLAPRRTTVCVRGG